MKFLDLAGFQYFVTKVIGKTSISGIGDGTLTGAVSTHTNNKSNPHSVTKAQVGLSNVPNVATNDQTPSYTAASSLTALSSGEKLSVAFGKLSKAVSSLISHLADSVGHITAAERTVWNAKLDATATAVNADTVDGHHAGDFVLLSDYAYKIIGSSEVVDLNTLVTTKDYAFSVASITIALNAPTTSPGILSVTKGGGYTAQRYHTTADTVYIRSFNGEKWSEWADTSDADTVGGYPASSFVLLSDYSIRLIGLDEAMDFNNLMTTKNYAFNTSSIALAANAPVQVNGILYVTKGGYYTQQEYVTMDNRVYRRCHNGSNWSDWRKALDAGSSVPVAISSTAPTDTTTLWVDTAAMKLKIYKNGAWTALS